MDYSNHEVTKNGRPEKTIWITLIRNWIVLSILSYDVHIVFRYVNAHCIVQFLRICSPFNFCIRDGNTTFTNNFNYLISWNEWGSNEKREIVGANSSTNSWWNIDTTRNFGYTNLLDFVKNIIKAGLL
jgi:hypothetical protein